MKALDPQGEARARALVGRAAELSDQAVGRTERLREALSDARIMASMAGLVRDLTVASGVGKARAAGKRRKPRRPYSMAARRCAAGLDGTPLRKQPCGGAG